MSPSISAGPMTQHIQRLIHIKHYGSIYSYQERRYKMGIAVKKTISLPPELAREVEEISREEKKSISAVIQNALRVAKKERLKEEFYQIQNYWSRKAKEKGILTEKDLERYLKL
jgi:Arc/MetJ-type ribon-helix-helix transcriptional regulator